MFNKEYKNLLEFIKTFDTEQKCIDYFTLLRWNDKIKCPHCNNSKYYAFKDKKTYKCKKCTLKFNVKTKTIFEGSNIKLQKWFMAIYLCNSLKRGIASAQLSRDIGVTQKTAWFMLQRLRLIFENQETKNFDDSTPIELDETYIGGKNKNRHYNKKVKNAQGRSYIDKTPVFGILQRNGKVVSMPVKDVKSNTLKPIITQFIKPGATIMTDEWSSYRGLNKVYNHKFVTHSKGQYVKNDCYTNTLEGYWAIIKRSIMGSYYNISKKHLNRYCKEFDFRYNTRNDSIKTKIELTLANAQGRLKYKNLIK